MIYGLTGGIGSGKSTLSQMLQSYGFQIIDADKITHELHRDPYICNTLTSTFGPDVVMHTLTGICVNRKTLGAQVFADPNAREKLDAIMRPALRHEATKRLHASTAPTVLDAALLFEAGWQDLTDVNIVVLCPEATRLSRIIARDALPESRARARIRAQMSDTERIQLADRLIYNTGDLANLLRQAKRIFDIDIAFPNCPK